MCQDILGGGGGGDGDSHTDMTAVLVKIYKRKPRVTSVGVAPANSYPRHLPQPNSYHKARACLYRYERMLLVFFLKLIREVWRNKTVFTRKFPAVFL